MVGWALDDEESEEEVTAPKTTVPIPKRRFEGEDEEEDVAVSTLRFFDAMETSPFHLELMKWFIVR